jgi:RNA recognition motif-containing protein
MVTSFTIIIFPFLFNRYGEIVNINLIRDKSTGKSKGFGFICYEDQRSTILAVDNFNGIKVIFFVEEDSICRAVLVCQNSSMGL